MKIFIAALLFFLLFSLRTAPVAAQEGAALPVPAAVNQEAVTGTLPVSANMEASAQKPAPSETSTVEPRPVDAGVPPAAQPAAPKIAPAMDHTIFNKMKSLAGRWAGVGKNNPEHAEDKIAVTYEVTAGGNAVMERLFPGTPQEMVTLYYENKGQLELTHFCMLGNRPVMKLKEPQANVYEFDLVPAPDIDAAVDTHMHSLKITFVNDDHMNQEWIMYEAGKVSGSHFFQLTRVPAAQ